MSRRGTSLIEFLGVIILLGTLLPLLSVATVRCLRLGRELKDRPLRTDLLESACLRLRADAAAGWSWEAGRLVTARSTWSVEDGWLRRDGANRYASCSWEASEERGNLRLVISAAGLPDRVLLLEGGAP